jgi:tetratricopeptide (TPR) repeat protein
MFPPKFKNANSFNILILPFNRLEKIEIKDIRIEESIENELNKRSELEGLNLQVIFDDRNFTYKTFEDAEKEGFKRNANLVIFGDIYEGDLEHQTNIKYVYLKNEPVFSTLMLDDTSYISIKFKGIDNATLSIRSQTEPIKMPSIAEISRGILKPNVETTIILALFLNAYENKDFKKAYDLSTKLIFTNKEKIIWLSYFQLNCLNNLKNDKELLKIYTNLINDTILNFNKLHFILNRGLSYKHLKNFQAALNDYNLVIQQNPKYGIAFLNRGNLNVEMERYDLALKDYNTAINIDNKHGRVYYARSAVYMYFNEFDKAKNDFNKAIELGYENSELYMNRGVLYRNIEKFDESLEDFNKAIELNPANKLALINRASLYYELKEYDKTIADCSTIINKDLTFVNAYLLRAECYIKMENYENSLNDYLKVTSINDTLKNKYAKVIVDLENKIHR